MLSAEQSDSPEADEEADFVTRQARLRMGRFYDSEFVLDAARLRDRLSAVDPKRPLLIFRIENGAAQTVYESSEYAKNQQFMKIVTLHHAHDDGVYCADFEDSMPTEYFPFSSDAIPLFSKNRPVGADTSVILWTHANYRRNREAGIAGRSSNLPWKKKIPELIWRGCPRGSIQNLDGAFVRAGQIYAATMNPKQDPFLAKYGGRDFREVAAELFDRFRLISRYADKFNVRFVDFPNAVVRESGFRRYLAENYEYAERMPVEEIARYKYLFVLGGNDAGTQINWALSARSVILMPPIRFHSTTTLGLKVLRCQCLASLMLLVW